MIWESLLEKMLYVKRSTHHLWRRCSPHLVDSKYSSLICCHFLPNIQCPFHKRMSSSGVIAERTILGLRWPIHRLRTRSEGTSNCFASFVHKGPPTTPSFRYWATVLLMIWSCALDQLYSLRAFLVGGLDPCAAFDALLAEWSVRSFSDWYALGPNLLRMKSWNPGLVLNNNGGL